MKTHQDIKKVLITAEEIASRVQQLATQISADYNGKKLLTVGVLKGACMFMTDLVRAMDLDTEIEFIAVSSYGNSTKSSGKVKVLKDLSVNCAGRDVLIVEDIVDSGVTMTFLKDAILSRGANSVAAASLLSKPSRRKVNVDVEYVGFEIPDEFVIGYGMDYGEKFRGLTDICILKEECYK